MNGGGLAGSVTQRPSVLVLAGVDPSGGAGIAADLQAIAAQGAHALTVVTALTVQDNDRVFAVHPVAPELLLLQAQALIDKIEISAVKIGITGSAANARAIAQLIVQLRQRRPDLPVVLDTVLASGHGDMLSRDDAVQALAPLLPLATLITPNGPEAAALCGPAAGAIAALPSHAATLAPRPEHAGARASVSAPAPAHPDGQAARAHAHARLLLARGCANVLVSGGHEDGDTVVNRWFAADGTQQDWSWPRLHAEFHGSGCTLAAAIAGQLAQRLPLPRALAKAQQYCHDALQHAYAIAPGQLMPRR